LVTSIYAIVFDGIYLDDCASLYDQ